MKFITMCAGTIALLFAIRFFTIPDWREIVWHYVSIVLFLFGPSCFYCFLFTMVSHTLTERREMAHQRHASVSNVFSEPSYLETERGLSKELGRAVFTYLSWIPVAAFVVWFLLPTARSGVQALCTLFIALVVSVFKGIWQSEEIDKQYRHYAWNDEHDHLFGKMIENRETPLTSGDRWRILFTYTIVHSIPINLAFFILRWIFLYV